MAKWLNDKRSREHLQHNPAIHPKERMLMQDLVDDVDWSSSSSSLSSSSSSSLSSSSSSSSSSA